MIKCVACLLSGRKNPLEAEYVVNGYSVCFDPDDESHWNAAANARNYHDLVMDARNS